MYCFPILEKAKTTQSTAANPPCFRKLIVEAGAEVRKPTCHTEERFKMLSRGVSASGGDYGDPLVPVPAGAKRWLPARQYLTRCLLQRLTAALSSVKRTPSPEAVHQGFYAESAHRTTGEMENYELIPSGRIKLP
ncbi:hypothetical protein MG293_000028 [Ovis ammon polii]|uniref:Uncharacterized protein n=1 Tax=Ovis ammon polii TaxID=230172 RepID=A0AAD4UI67_OVIAM|nr:hypothetical protein MG293_000028 [Ovis ammon polii]KAI4578648.1 hypothetical protein MJT46_000016 [Ovis ammon polii x Ovis aries]